MDTLALIPALTAIVVFALYFGALLSDKLPEWDRRFDHKPFNCRPCLTFHLTWSASAAVAFFVSSPLLFLSGVGVAFVVFAIVKYIDNQKIEK